MKRAAVLAIATATALAVGSGLAACSGGSDDQADYVDALTEAAASEDPTATEGQRRCFAESAVDVVGVERLEEVASPDEISEAETTDIAALGVEISDAEGEEFYGLYSECVDLREVLIAGAAGTQDISAEAVACLETELDEDLLRRFVVVGFAQGAAAALEDEELVTGIQTAFTTCTAAPVPEG